MDTVSHSHRMSSSCGRKILIQQQKSLLYLITILSSTLILNDSDSKMNENDLVTRGGITAAESRYMDQEEKIKLKVLFAMAVGLSVEQRHAVALDSVVERSNSLSIRDVTPTSVQLVDEIVRRAEFLVLSGVIQKAPRPKHWSNNDRNVWLNKYPLKVTMRYLLVWKLQK